MPFEKDLGYLEQFFDKLEAHAETLPATAQQNLGAFVAQQRISWENVREILFAPSERDREVGADVFAPQSADGVQVAPAAEHAQPSSTARSARDADPARTPAPRQTASAQPAPPPPRDARGAQLTVGSLIPDPSERG